MKKIFRYISLIPALIYRAFTTKAFYLSGTFLTDVGQRMFFRVTFTTYGDIMPIQSIETILAKQYGVERCCILHISRIPRRMVKYVSMDYKGDLSMFQYEGENFGIL